MLTLLELGHSSCRWPVGEFEPGTFLFCGDAALTGKPYCSCHTALAYETQAQRRQRAVQFAASRQTPAAKTAARRWNQFVGEADAKARHAELANMP